MDAQLAYCKAAAFSTYSEAVRAGWGSVWDLPALLPHRRSEGKEAPALWR